jgi:hypothetical protein
VDRSHGQISLANQFRGAAAFSRALPWVLAPVAAACGLASSGPIQPALLCAAMSGVLLGLIDRCEARLGWRLSRVLADVALMTPLVFVIPRSISP